MSGRERKKRPDEYTKTDVRDDYNYNTSTSQNASSSLDDQVSKNAEKKERKQEE